MSRSIRILERARADVDDVFNWLVRRSVSGAVAWYLAFAEAIRSIAAAPEGFAEAAESEALRRPIRQALFKTRRGRKYRIVFEVSDGAVVGHDLPPGQHR